MGVPQGSVLGPFLFLFLNVNYECFKKVFNLPSLLGFRFPVSLSDTFCYVKCVKRMIVFDNSKSKLFEY